MSKKHFYRPLAFTLSNHQIKTRKNLRICKLITVLKNFKAAVAVVELIKLIDLLSFIEHSSSLW